MIAEKSLSTQITVEPCRPFTVRSLAFTHSEKSSVSMVWSTGVAGSRLGFKSLTLADVLTVSNRRESTAQTCSNPGAYIAHYRQQQCSTEREHFTGSIGCKYSTDLCLSLSMTPNWGFWLAIQFWPLATMSNYVVSNPIVLSSLS